MELSIAIDLLRIMFTLLSISGVIIAIILLYIVISILVGIIVGFIKGGKK